MMKSATKNHHATRLTLHFIRVAQKVAEGTTGGISSQGHANSTKMGELKACLVLFQICFQCHSASARGAVRSDTFRAADAALKVPELRMGILRG